MTKMQADVRNTESSVLSYLLSQIGKTDMKFNAIKAVVNAKSSYVLVGQPYKAEIFIAAYDSTQNPDILVGGSPIPVNNGVGVFTGNTSSVGPKSFGGVIKLKNKSTGEIKDYPFKGEYEVGQSSLSVSPTKMNVLYIGVPNPIDITASGVPAEKLNVSISGGSITKAGQTGSYVAQVKAPGTVNITVTANVDGQTKNLGSKQFRVKRVPDPVAKVAGKRDGTVTKAELAAQAGVKADLENFDFDMKFNVVSFKVSATIKGFSQDATANSAAFTAQQKQIISQVPSGGKIYIEDIKAKGPDGSIRSLGTIAFKIK
jgi:gliding motility-associated protein GldM